MNNADSTGPKRDPNQPPRAPLGAGGWIIIAAAVLFAYSYGYKSGKADPANPIAPSSLFNSATSPADDTIADNLTAADYEQPSIPVPTPVTSATPIYDSAALDEDGDGDATNARPLAAADTAPDDDGSASDPLDSIATVPVARTYSPSTYSPSGYASAPSSNTPNAQSTGPVCSESGSCYGDISATTGLPKTTYVHGYFRRNGTYVGSYYRSHR